MAVLIQLLLWICHERVDEIVRRHGVQPTFTELPHRRCALRPRIRTLSQCALSYSTKLLTKRGFKFFESPFYEIRRTILNCGAEVVRYLSVASFRFIVWRD